MKYIIIILSAFIFIGCNQKLPDPQSDSPSKSKLATEAQRKVATKMYQENKLRAIGSGAQMMDQIKMLALSFYYYEPLDEEKARELLLAATNELIFAVNEDERIRPYLHNYPFESKNVEIRIFIYNPDGSKVSAEKLCVISAIDGIFDYDVDDHKNQFFTTTVLKETYEEAMQRQNKLVLQKTKTLPSL